VCPWNVSFSQALTETAFEPREILRGKNARELSLELLAMSQSEFSTAFRNSPMKRAKRRGVARNATLVLGNIANADDVPVLQKALQHDEELVREHAAWALGRIGSSRAATALQERLVDEPDADVREEIASALRVLDGHR
jgi:epoxyqueuosine reductase